ncbi:uncharacterized protein LOC129758759 [Uranotaenia lowii]|uniref:uncharacterized protein LOC129758759 n=1 Tax=Uranotaenia lowii TaxID=190385 RepID=UPI0024786551|nr:uncharacterized protein LOC129758759 [Uranotaenia lowii]
MLRLSCLCVLLVAVGLTLAEAPLPGGSNGGGGGYQQVSSGPQTSDGQRVDPELLEMLKMLLLQHESEQSNGNGNGGSSGQFGSYGPPAGSSSQGRVTGIDLEDPRQSKQVAEFWQGGQEQAPPSGSYGAPSGSYGAPVGRK